MRGAGCPRVTQPFATLCTPEGALTVRLACVRRAASVHPEPGSNSPFERAPGSPACVSSLGARRSVQDPADLDSLGFELTLSNNSNFALLSLVDLSIAVSGSQGSRRPGGRLSPARREEIYYALSSPPPSTIRIITYHPYLSSCGQIGLSQQILLIATLDIVGCHVQEPVPSSNAVRLGIDPHCGLPSGRSHHEPRVIEELELETIGVITLQS